MAQQGSDTHTGSAGGDGAALVGAIAWAVLVGLLFWLTWPENDAQGAFAAGRLILVLIAVFVPAGAIFLVGSLRIALRDMRAELDQARFQLGRLAEAQAAQSALTKTLSAQAAAARPTALADPSEVVAQNPAPVGGEIKSEAAVTPFSSRREVSRLITPRAAPQAPADQQTMQLETPSAPQDPPIARHDLIKALHFPDDEHDVEGFAALRRALRDLGARKLVQASQDVLTLLSQDGIYMDDLRPAPASPDLWRRFAKGERGKSLDQLGGIKDQGYLSLISRRTREDTIFRDSVHHFLRCFDQLLVGFEPDATDAELLALGETRTARAFMTLARATGTFD